MARTPLSDSRKSDKPLKIRVTDKERAALDKAAQAAKKPTSTWARDLLLEVAAPAKKPRRKSPAKS